MCYTNMMKSSFVTRTSMLMGVFLSLYTIGCTNDSKNVSQETSSFVPTTPTPFTGQELDSLPLAKRLSLDLRGEFLDWDEVLQIQQDPDCLDEMVSKWMQESGHQAQLLDIFSSMLLTKVDEFNVTEADFYLDEALEYDFVQAIGEESPRLMVDVAMSDAPWTEVVKVDYTMANQILIDIWNLEPINGSSSGSDDWVKAKYTDGRPSLGVVSTNGIWWRYYTTPNNKSRARAAFLTRLLVCDDILSRAVTSPSSLQVDAENIDEFVRTDPGCLSCHRTLDPVAASLYGFWQHDMHDVVELSLYHPEREWDGERDLQVEMAWYGQSVTAPAQLGERIAEDERFYTCATTLLAERMWRRGITDIDTGRIETIAYEAQQAGGQYKYILKGVIAAPEYRMLSADDPSDTRAMSTSKMMTAHQLTHAIQELTGFEWRDDQLPLLDNDEWGYRMLLGGIDGRSTTQWLEAPSATRQLTLKRLAQLASEYAVQEAIEGRGDLFESLNPLEVSAEDDAFAELVSHWNLRLLGRDVLSNELSAIQSNFASVEETSNRETAWKILLSIYLRNTQTWLY